MFQISDLPATMQAKVKVTETSCWEWQGARGSRGYGSVTNGIDGRSMLAHRRAFEELVGQIPEGLTLDHLCSNKPCVNPAHLEPVTNTENIRRALEAKTHCKYGHELSGENLRLKERSDGRTYRVCIACDRRHSIESRAKRAAVETYLKSREVTIERAA